MDATPIKTTFLITTRNGAYKNAPVVGGWMEVFRFMHEENLRSAKVKNHLMGTYHQVRVTKDGDYHVGADY